MLALRIVSCVICSVFSLLRPLKCAQSNFYRVRDCLPAIVRAPRYIAICIVFAAFSAFIKGVWLVLLAALYCALLTFDYFFRRRQRLKFTARAKELVLLSAALAALIGVIIGLTPPVFPAFIAGYPTVFLALALLAPHRKKILDGYKAKARKKLDEYRPVVVAITGSYGKTTFKNILARLLSAKYSVCASRASFNTPMGLCVTVNDDLKKSDEILIVEMGARRRGEIKELCDFIRPDYCVITAIGEQHLKTFGSVANVYKEKTSISWGGEKATFFNVDNALCRKAAARYGENAIVTGEDTSGFRPEKSVRDEVSKEAPRKISAYGFVSGEFDCPMRQSYAPSLITLALAVAKTLKVREKALKNAVKSVKGVAHRQQILYNGNDVIIDDSYNSNPQGFLSALSLIGKYDKVRVIITPGVVEGGRNQYALNKFLGGKAAVACDFVLVYGPNARALKKGGGDKVKVFPSLAACMKKKKKIRGERAVLFENDLPDVLT